MINHQPVNDAEKIFFDETGGKKYDGNLLNCTKINDNDNIGKIQQVNTEEEDTIIAIKKRTDLKDLGKGTYGTVKPIDFIYKSGKRSSGALKIMHRTHVISGFGNLPEIEMSIKFGGITFVPEIIIVEVTPYCFYPRDGLEHDEFLSIGTKKAYCDGAELAKRGGYTIEHTLKIAIEIFSALKYMHGRNVCHRDIKPGNVLIYMNNGVPTAQLTDFGFACHLTKASARSKNVNTAWYRAPEVLWGLNYKNNSDIWSAGCTIYEIATGNILFKSPDGNEEETKLFFERQLSLVPTEWTIEMQSHYRAKSELSGMHVFGSDAIRKIEQPSKSYIKQFRSLPRYKSREEPHWNAIDRMLIHTFNFNYNTRMGASNILADNCFDSQRDYIAHISKHQDKPQTNDVIVIMIKPEINKMKIDFFTEAYERFVKVERRLSPRAIFHAMDLANIFLTTYQETSMNLNNVFACCLYFFNKTFSISVYPSNPEKFFWKTFSVYEIENDESKLMELDKLIYEFECIVIDKEKMVGFKTYRPNLFEMQDFYSHNLNSSQLYTLFQEFALINEWKEKSFRYMYRFLYNKLFDHNFIV